MLVSFMRFYFYSFSWVYVCSLFWCFFVVFEATVFFFLLQIKPCCCCSPTQIHTHILAFGRFLRHHTKRKFRTLTNLARVYFSHSHFHFCCRFCWNIMFPFLCSFFSMVLTSESCPVDCHINGVHNEKTRNWSAVVLIHINHFVKQNDIL